MKEQQIPNSIIDNLRLRINEMIMKKHLSITDQERIAREEIPNITKKINLGSLITAGICVILLGVLMILQNQLHFFSQEYIIPLFILIFTIILLLMILFVFFILRFKGYQKLEENIGSLKTIQAQLKNQKKSNTQAFFYIKTITEEFLENKSKNIFPSLPLRIISEKYSFESYKTPIKQLYHILLLISMNRKKSLEKLFEENTFTKTFTDELEQLIQIYLTFIEKLQSKKAFPRYFKEEINKQIENIKTFDLQSFNISYIEK